MTYAIATTPQARTKPHLCCRTSPTGIFYVWRWHPLAALNPPALGGQGSEFGWGQTAAEAYADFCRQQADRIWPATATS